MFHVPNQYRIKNHPLLGSEDGNGNNEWHGLEVKCQASDGLGWEHVSVSINRKIDERLNHDQHISIPSDITSIHPQ